MPRRVSGGGGAGVRVGGVVSPPDCYAGRVAGQARVQRAGVGVRVGTGVRAGVLQQGRVVGTSAQSRWVHTLRKPLCRWISVLFRVCRCLTWRTLCYCLCLRTPCWQCAQLLTWPWSTLSLRLHTLSWWRRTLPCGDAVPHAAPLSGGEGGFLLASARLCARPGSLG